MLARQGKVLSPENEGSMAVIVYVVIFPQLCFICVHMPISGLSSLVQFLYMPATVRQPCAERKPAVWIPIWIVHGIARDLCEGVFFYFCGNADPGEEQDHGSDRWKGYSRGRSW